jgi:uncharacterized Zn finger protein
MARKTSLAELVTEAALRSLAGASYFQRGEGYFRSGAVERLRSDEAEVAAVVIGTEAYRSRIRIARGKLAWECSCPLGDDGEFCKHLVATGLAWLAAGGKSNAAPGREAIRAYLDSCDRRKLVELLMDQVENDDELTSRLLVAASGDKTVDAAAVRETLRNLFATRGFIEYGEMRSFVGRAAPAVDLVKAVLDKGRAGDAAELAEFAIRLAFRALEQGDDSDGGLGAIVSEIATLHAKAARLGAFPPKTLAKRLLAMELADGYGFFDRKDYRDALGAEGLAAYRALAAAEWKRVPARGPRDKRRDDSSRHYAITGVMEELAREDGDVDALVGVLRKDLTSTTGYMDIAEALAKAGRHEEALRWAEEGRRAHPRETNLPLDDFIVEGRHRQGRHDEAIRMRWVSFEESPSLSAYRDLKKSADKTRSWKGWREKALALARREASRKSGSSRGFWAPASVGLPVEILLWEGDANAALDEARTGGCDERLWLKLAGALERSRPDEAVAIYGERIGPIVARGGNAAYDEAVGLVRRYRSLLDGSGRGAEFPAFVERLRREHRAKRNFMALLDAVERDRAAKSPTALDRR